MLALNLSRATSPLHPLTTEVACARIPPKIDEKTVPFENRRVENIPSIKAMN